MPYNISSTQRENSISVTTHHIIRFLFLWNLASPEGQGRNPPLQEGLGIELSYSRWIYWNSRWEAADQIPSFLKSTCLDWRETLICNHWASDPLLWFYLCIFLPGHLLWLCNLSFHCPEVSHTEPVHIESGSQLPQPQNSNTKQFWRLRGIFCTDCRMEPRFISISSTCFFCYIFMRNIAEVVHWQS